MAFRRKPASYAEIAALPEHLIGEIIDGELIVSPRPAPRHANASSVLGSDLVGPYHRGRGGPGGWWILPEPELHLREDITTIEQELIVKTLRYGYSVARLLLFR